MSRNFNIYRRDKRFKNGGGLLIFICSKYTFELIDLGSSVDIEFICVRVSNRVKSIYITCSYIPPCSDIHIYSAHYVLISKVIDLMGQEGIRVVLCDFNLTHTSWHFSPETGSLVQCSLVPFYDEILSTMYDLDLFQVNRVLNSRGKILDLVFLENPSIASLFRVDPISVPEDSQNPSLLLFIKIDLCLSPIIDRSVGSERRFNFHRTDFTRLNTNYPL